MTIAKRKPPLKMQNLDGQHETTHLRLQCSIRIIACKPIRSKQYVACIAMQRTNRTRNKPRSQKENLVAEKSLFRLLEIGTCRAKLPHQHALFKMQSPTSLYDLRGLFAGNSVRKEQYKLTKREERRFVGEYGPFYR